MCSIIPRKKVLKTQRSLREVMQQYIQVNLVCTTDQLILQKKVHMEVHCPNLILPPPPFKSKDENRRDIFGGLDPPPPPSEVGKFFKLLYLPRNDFQRNYFQSFTLYFIKICKNGLQVVENVKIGKS